MSIDKVLYTAHAKATGGRDGRAVSSDGILDVKLVRPREAAPHESPCRKCGVLLLRPDRVHGGPTLMRPDASKSFPCTSSGPIVS